MGLKPVRDMDPVQWADGITHHGLGLPFDDAKSPSWQHGWQFASPFPKPHTRLSALARQICRPTHPTIAQDEGYARGAPRIAGTGIPTWILKGRFRDGESVDSLARDYELTRDEIEEALRFETKARSRQRRELTQRRQEDQPRHDED